MINADKKQFLNEQQLNFLKYYLDPERDTFSNARQSALKAGFSGKYADNITALMPKWLESSLEDSNLVRQALDNLGDFIGKEENRALRWDATKFVLSTLNKNKFSTRKELTGKGGEDLIPSDESREQASKLIKEYLEQNKKDTGDNK